MAGWGSGGEGVGVRGGGTNTGHCNWDVKRKKKNSALFYMTAWAKFSYYFSLI